MKYTMPKRLKNKWVKALRSGNYKQGATCMYTGTLDGVPVMCCLGVLEHICGTATKKLFAIGLPGHLIKPKSPQEFWSTIDTGISMRLAEKNDSGKWSFKKIATWIEKNL